jgi:hypothetical protein
MKKIVSILLIVLTFSGCIKREMPMEEDTQEVTFSSTEITDSQGFKSTTDYECMPNLSPDYAKIVLAEFPDPFYPKVFRLEGKLYTQAIKLPVGTYTVTHFLIYDEMTTPDDMGDDELYMAIPEAGTFFADFTNPDVTFTFAVAAFTKTECPVEILCFQPQYYDLFGFNWYATTEIVVREQCFFGDVCVNPDEYLTSLYDLEQDPDGCQVDMPAIIRIKVTKNGTAVYGSPFTNANAAANYGVGAPLCVQYPDDLSVTGEVFSFELYVLVKSTVPGVFIYQLYNTFQVTDDEMIGNGGDGVVDFAIGDCSPYADYIFTWLSPPVPPH